MTTEIDLVDFIDLINPEMYFGEVQLTPMAKIFE